MRKENIFDLYEAQHKDDKPEKTERLPDEVPAEGAKFEEVTKEEPEQKAPEQPEPEKEEPEPEDKKGGNEDGV